MIGFKPTIHTYTTPPSFRVNVYLVETEHGVVLIDGAIALSTSRAIRQIINEQIRKPLLAVLLTHGHPDHYVGVGEIVRGFDVPIIATQGVADFARLQDQEPVRTLIQRFYGKDVPDTWVLPYRLVSNNEVLVLDNIAFRVEDLGPCESGSDSLWIMTCDEVPHVFLGDIVSNHVHCSLRDAHVIHWLAVLDQLLDNLPSIALLYPGHGKNCGIEMVYWQKAYLEAFLGILYALLDGKTTLSGAEKDLLICRMKSFLPDDQNLSQLTDDLDETVHQLMLQTGTGTSAFCLQAELAKTAFKTGIVLQRLGRGQNINAVHWNFQDGVVMESQHHRQEQFGYVIKGGFETTIGTETHRLQAGDAYFVPPNIPHAFVSIGETEAIDVFTPIRVIGEKA